MELFLAKYKITFTHIETGAVVVHYFEEHKRGVMLDYIASQNKNEEFHVHIELIDKVVAHFD